MFTFAYVTKGSPSGFRGYLEFVLRSKSHVTLHMMLL